jgi:membrane-associated phospholipid phosphatase
VFLALTVVATVYLGWHYFLDAVGGFVLGVAGVWIAARGTGNEMRRRPAGSQPLAISEEPSRTA